MTLKHRVIGWRYLTVKHNYSHDAPEALVTLERQGRDAFLRGDPCEDYIPNLTSEEFNAYRRGFNSEARMHGYE